MALSITAVDSCNEISIKARPVTGAATGEIIVKSITAGTSTKHPVTFSSGQITLKLPTSELGSSSGVFLISITETGQTSATSTKALLLHCDIDCCLVKLTNELLACDCDCPKCSRALAKAQKVFLLLHSALAAVDEIGSTAKGSEDSGRYKDINEKYLKAKEICDGSCGCEC